MVWPAVVDVVAAGFDRERWNLEFGIWKFLPSRFLFFLEVRRANQLITRKGHLNNSPSRLNPWD
jgi:hypothetical protein